MRPIKPNAFSMVEMSIVIVIIGLLVGAVMAGTTLIRAAELRSIMSQVAQFKTALNSFEQIYTELPGDFSNATDYWATSNNGDGDGDINSNAGGDHEDLWAWNQLALAELIPGNYVGEQAPLYVAETTMPESSMENVLYRLSTRVTNIYGTKAGSLRLQLAPPSANGNSIQHADFGAMTAEDAYSIDEKIDDGSPSTGSVYAHGPNLNSDATECTDADTDTGTPAATPNYVFGSNMPLCNLQFWLE